MLGCGSSRGTCAVSTALQAHGGLRMCRGVPTCFLQWLWVTGRRRGPRGGRGELREPRGWGQRLKHACGIHGPWEGCGSGLWKSTGKVKGKRGFLLRLGQGAQRDALTQGGGNRQAERVVREKKKGKRKKEKKSQKCPSCMSKEESVSLRQPRPRPLHPPSTPGAPAPTSRPW